MEILIDVLATAHPIALTALNFAKRISIGANAGKEFDLIHSRHTLSSFCPIAGSMESVSGADLNRANSSCCQRSNPRHEKKLTSRSNDETNCKDLYNQSAVEKAVFVIISTHPSIAA